MNRVREFRKRRKWTQAALAIHAGIQQSDISNIENERGAILLRHAKRIAAAFGVKTWAVFTDGVREPDYWNQYIPRKGSRFVPWTVHLCHWCGFPYDPEKEKPLKVRVKGRERIYGHEKCRQEHRDTERYA